MRAPPMRRRGAVLLAALLLPVAVEAAPLDWLAIPDPVSETAASADAAFAESCRASARERLGEAQLRFDRPVFSARDGLRIVRMDLGIAGQPREPGRLFRAVCAREAGASVDAIVFDRPAESGPRVTVLAGPTPEMRPRDDDPGYRIVARDPSGEDDIALIYQGYDADYLPGLWVPYGGYSYGGRWFGDAGGSRHLRRGPGIEPGRAPTDRIVAIPRGSSAPFSDGGIASPGISNFSPKAARGGIASPAISNFSPRAVRGGGVRVGGGVRAGGGGARAGSIGR